MGHLLYLSFCFLKKSSKDAKCTSGKRSNNHWNLKEEAFSAEVFEYSSGIEETLIQIIKKEAAQTQGCGSLTWSFHFLSAQKQRFVCMVVFIDSLFERIFMFFS